MTLSDSGLWPRQLPWKLVGAALLVLCSSNVWAQSTPDLLRPRFQADPTRNYLVTPAAEVNDEFGWNLGLLAGYAHQPLRLVDGDGNDLGGLVDSQFYGILGVSIAAWERLQFSLDLPVALAQSAGTATLDGASTATAVGDLRAQAVVSLWSSRDELDEPGVALGVIGEVTVPTGNGAAYAGGALGGGGGLVVEAFANDRTHFALSGVFQASPTVRAANTRLDDAIRWSVAAERRLGENWSIVGDLAGSAGTGADGEPANQRPMELLSAGRYHRGVVYSQFGGGLGISRGVGTPVFRVFAGVGVSPMGNRWRGAVEPMLVPPPAPEPEPVVVVAPQPQPVPECTADDMSGCAPAPAPSCEDGALLTWSVTCIDGVCGLDSARSACPSGHVCTPDSTVGAACLPEQVHVPTAVVDDVLQQIVINEVILFEFDRDVIQRVSYEILDRVAELINRETDIDRVRVEGHTDFIGDARYNQDLSERRARAVVRALVERGVDPSRLDSAGFGFSRPVDPARTDAARARNRRVEFHIEEAP